MTQYSHYAYPMCPLQQKKNPVIAEEIQISSGIFEKLVSGQNFKIAFNSVKAIIFTF